MCSRVLGLIRDRLLATSFGASTTLDAFMIAFSLPNLFRQLFGEGTLSSAFTPRYIALREKAENSDQSEQPAEQFAGVVLTRLALLLSVIAALGMLIAGLFIMYGAPRHALVASLAISQLPYLIFICVSAVMAGMLHARDVFGIPAAAPILLNVILILCVVWFPTVDALPYAVLFAGIIQLSLHAWGLWRSRGGFPRLHLKSTAALVDLRKAWVPTLVGSGAQQLNVFLDGMIAYLMLSHRPGAVTILYMANRLLQLPMALISGSVGTVIYPDLARAALQGWDEVGKVMRRGTTVVTALLLPAAVGLWLCAESLVITIFRSGAFSVDDAERTVFVTQFVAIALLPLGYYKLLIRALNAGRQERKPMRIALVSVVINTVLNLILVQTPLYEAGLALASLISGTIACLMSAVSLHRIGTGMLFDGRRLLRPIVCTVLMAGAVYGLLLAWPLASSAAVVDHLWRLTATVSLGIIVYGLAMGPGNIRSLRR